MITLTFECDIRDMTATINPDFIDSCDPGLKRQPPDHALTFCQTGLINSIHRPARRLGPALLSGPILPELTAQAFMRPVVAIVDRFVAQIAQNVPGTGLRSMHRNPHPP